MTTANLITKQAGAEERREGLTIERYAEVMAYRRHFPASRRTEVLLRLGIRPNRWAAATKAWGAALAEALLRDEPELTLRFAKTLGATARRLREFPPRLEDLGEPVDPNTQEPSERAAPAERPSFMLEEAPPTPRLGWASPPPSPAWPGAPEGPRPARPPALVETAEIGPFVPRNPLPFSPAPPGPPGAPAPRPSGSKR
jgi:hypothetical protein